VERGFELGVKLGKLVVGLVESVGKGDALFQFYPCLLH